MKYLFIFTLFLIISCSNSEEYYYTTIDEAKDAGFGHVNLQLFNNNNFKLTRYSYKHVGTTPEFAEMWIADTSFYYGSWEINNDSFELLFNKPDSIIQNFYSNSNYKIGEKVDFFKPNIAKFKIDADTIVIFDFLCKKINSIKINFLYPNQKASLTY